MGMCVLDVVAGEALAPVVLVDVEPHPWQPWTMHQSRTAPAPADRVKA